VEQVGVKPAMIEWGSYRWWE